MYMSDKINYDMEFDENDVEQDLGDIVSQMNPELKELEEDVWDKLKYLYTVRSKNATLTYQITSVNKKFIEGMTPDGISVYHKYERLGGANLTREEVDMLLGHEIKGFIVAIDEDTRRVETSEKILVEIHKNNIRTMDKSSKSRRKVVNLIKRKLEAGKEEIIPARVTDYNPVVGVVQLDLGGLGINAFIPIKEWDVTYVYNPKITIKSFKGKFIKVKIMDLVYKEDSKFPSIVCSRKATIKYDPWKDIEKRFPKNTELKVTCIEKKAEYFYATNDTLKGISILCYYSNNGFKVREGAQYIVYVKAVSEESKKLTAKLKKEAKKKPYARTNQVTTKPVVKVEKVGDIFDEF